MTGNKNITHSKAFKSHILTKKASKRKRNLGRKALVSKADRKTVKTMLPYDF